MKKKALLALSLSMALVLGTVSHPVSVRADSAGREEIAARDKAGGEPAAAEKEAGAETGKAVTETEGGTEESAAEPSEDAPGEEGGAEESAAEPSEDASGEESGTEESAAEPSEDAPGEEGGAEESAAEPSEDAPGEESGAEKSDTEGPEAVTAAELAGEAEGNIPAESGADTVITNDENGIPDAALYKIVLEAGDADKNSILTMEEAAAITRLVPDGSVSDFTGLSKYLPNLGWLSGDEVTSDEAVDSFYREFIQLDKLSDLWYVKVRNEEDWNTLVGKESIKSLRMDFAWEDSSKADEVLDVSPFVRLEDLWLQGDFSSVSGLGTLTNLKDLEIDYYITYTPADERHEIIGDLPVTLRSLGLHGCNVTDIGATTIPQMTNLGALSLVNTGLKSLKGLEELNIGGTVEISYNEIENLEGIEGLLNSSYLRLHNNKLKSAEGIERLTNPRSVDLQGNQLTKIPDISGLTNMRVLNLSDNQLTSLPDLTGLTNLSTLHVFGNNLSEEEVKTKVPAKFSEDENWFSQAVKPFTGPFQQNLNSDDIGTLMAKGVTSITMEEGYQVELTNDFLENGLTEEDRLWIYYVGEEPVSYLLAKNLVSPEVKGNVVLKGSPVDGDVTEEDRAAVRALFAKYEEAPSVSYYTAPGIGMNFGVFVNQLGKYKLYYYNRSQKKVEKILDSLPARENSGRAMLYVYSFYLWDTEDGRINCAINEGMQYPASEGFYFIVGEEYSISGEENSPSPKPSEDPAPEQTAVPTVKPSAEPTATPSAEPTANPSAEPTANPSAEPTAGPSTEPTASPSAEPSVSPSAEPTATPSAEPTKEPGGQPSTEPSTEPTAVPTTAPTAVPTPEPTAAPTIAPTTAPTQAPAPDTKVPFIKGEPGKEGWEIIKEEAANAFQGKWITVDMNGTSVVPGNVLDRIKGQDVTLAFELENGIIWFVNGKNVTAEQANDVDFSVQVGTSDIPQNIVGSVAGSRQTTQLSLAYNGYFGYSAVLMVDLGKANAGLHANLFYYNESAGRLEFVTTDQINENGIAELVFSHASEYVIVVGDEVMGGNSDGNSNGNSSGSSSGSGDNGNSQETGVRSPKTGDADTVIGGANIAELQHERNSLNLIWLILIGAAVLAVTGTSVFLIYKKDNKMNR